VAETVPEMSEECAERPDGVVDLRRWRPASIWARVDGEFVRVGWMDNAEAVVHRLETDPRFAEKIGPGGVWWMYVERAKQVRHARDELRPGQTHVSQPKEMT
jgi:hypothetical protein